MTLNLITKALNTPSVIIHREINTLSHIDLPGRRHKYIDYSCSRALQMSVLSPYHDWYYNGSHRPLCQMKHDCTRRVSTSPKNSPVSAFCCNSATPPGLFASGNSPRHLKHDGALVGRQKTPCPQQNTIFHLELNEQVFTAFVFSH